ncbi:hypothetical protein [Brevundimonas variabilis]|uniref:Uncharacterized protein n=1 Tax=Brevundimonas variabilis TaxID=74312 RepID=A0A7W9CGI1_9CAUL|nr:hypothetical protein [Brevundimonas variabilis]MBB5745237.1 hypothetical protein [Brevundimonas variabilis]
MTPLQSFFLVSTLAIFAIGWLKGGHIERQAVLVLLMAYVAALFVQDLDRAAHQIAVAIVDGVLLLALIWMALRYDRWWLLVAVACQVLAMIAHGALWLNPDIGLRSNVVTRWLFGLIQLYALAGGVVERWLAGEPAASPGLQPRGAETG